MLLCCLLIVSFNPVLIPIAYCEFKAIRWFVGVSGIRQTLRWIFPKAFLPKEDIALVSYYNDWRFVVVYLHFQIKLGYVSNRIYPVQAIPEMAR